MRKRFLCLVFAIATAGVASAAAAGELTVKIADGRATVIARDVPVRQILAEWARVGNTRIVGGEKLLGGPISIELINVPEKEALDVLLRTAAGYLAAPRPPSVAGASLYDRVVVLATSRAPAAAAGLSPPPFNRQAIQQIPQPPPPDDDDDGEPGDQGPMPAPGAPNGSLQPFPGPAVIGPNGPMNGPTGVVNGPYGPMNGPNGPNGPFPANQQPPTTSPRPGQLPAPAQQQPNPYRPQGPPGPTAGRPGGESGPGQ